MFFCFRVFQIAVRGGGGGKSPPLLPLWVIEILLEGFLPGGGNLRRSDFDDLNLFQS